MRYAIVKDGKVVNLVESEPDFAAAQGWIPCSTHHEDGFNPITIGDTYENNQFSPQPEDFTKLWEAARFRRDTLLIRSDKIVLPDRWAAMNTETQQAWSSYRQALRDFPENNGAPNTNPKGIKFPVPPDPSFDFTGPRPE